MSVARRHGLDDGPQRPFGQVADDGAIEAEPDKHRDRYDRGEQHQDEVGRLRRELGAEAYGEAQPQHTEQGERVECHQQELLAVPRQRTAGHGPDPEYPFNSLAAPPRWPRGQRFVATPPGLSNAFMLWHHTASFLPQDLT